MQFQLTITGGPDEGTTRTLRDGELILIGRATTADLRLHDPAVSRMHCRIFVEGTVVTVKDAGSSTGTLVNGNTITLQTLQPGDSIRLGETQLQLQLDTVEEDLTQAVKPDPQQQKPKPRKTEKRQQRPASLDHPDALIGSRVGSLEIRHLLTRGRSGLIFEAKDVNNGLRVAFKLYYPSADAALEQRLARSVSLLRKRKHPNLMRLHECGKFRGRLCLAMEFVEGKTAAELIRTQGVGGMLGWRRVFEITKDIARTLEFLGENGILHRNIAPRTIFVSSETSKLGAPIFARSMDAVIDSKDADEPFGDPLYQAPEVTERNQEDIRTDIYSLGAVAYAMLTGQPPFLNGHTSADPELPSKFHLGIPPLLESAVITMLRHEPERRFQTATELIMALERVEKYTSTQK